MIRLLLLIKQLLSAAWKLPRSGRLGLSLLLGIGIAVLLFTTRVSAAGTVLLQYQDAKLSLPLSELQAFAADNPPAPALQDFFEKTQEDPETVRRLLTTQISPALGAVLPENFILFQINRTLGEPLGREDFGSLKTALQTAYRDDSAFSVLEVIEKYPKPDVRLTLSQLQKVYGDIDLFLTRLEPTLAIAQKLLPELVCDCSIVAADATADRTQPIVETIAPQSTPADSAILASSVSSTTIDQTDSTRSTAANLSAANRPIAYTQAQNQLKSLFAIANSPEHSAAQTDSLPADLLLSAATQTTAPAYANKRLVFAFGLFRPSISVGELTRFADTGELPRGWQFYVNVAKINPADLRKALTESVSAKLGFLDRALNTLLGEYFLYQVGQLVQTPSGDANIQALRAAIVLSAADDNHFSMLELLQRAPTQNIQVNGIRLARMGKLIGRLASRQGRAVAVADVEGWLLQIQAAIAKDICTCEAQPAGSSDTPTAVTAPEISAATVAQFLPANWQPVASHRKDYGIIKVVWLKGTPYEMGYQHGKLLHDEIASIGSTVINTAQFAGKGFALGHLASKRTYPAVVEECRGLVDATQDLGITMDVCMIIAYADVYQEILGYTLPRELFWNGCNQFVATNQATIDGRLYHGSSVDNDGSPVPYVIKNPVVFVRQPNDGLPHVFVAYPGVVWPNSGMNVAGISLGLDTAHPNSPKELSLQGRSNVQIMAEILKTATSFEEARTLMETQPRVRANLIMITDGKSKQAGVFEFTGKSLGVRELQRNGVLYVTNHFLLPKMYEKQPLPAEPSSVSRFARFEQLMEPNQSSSYYGKINPEVMAKILRDRVNPYTHEASPLTVFDDNASPGGNGSLRQAIYEPERLLLWIAAGNPPVPENPFVCFSAGELLGFPNATPCPSPSM